MDIQLICQDANLGLYISPCQNSVWNDTNKHIIWTWGVAGGHVAVILLVWLSKGSVTFCQLACRNRQKAWQIMAWKYPSLIFLLNMWAIWKSQDFWVLANSYTIKSDLSLSV